MGVADEHRGLQRLRDGEVYAVLDLGDRPRLDYAGADGPTVLGALTGGLLPATARVTGRAAIAHDALPMGKDDTAGLPLFYLAFAVVLSSYLFAITTTTQAPRLGPWGHWTSALALALTLSTTATLLARYAAHSLSGHAPTVALVLALASLGTGAASFALLRASVTFGSVLGTLVLVVLGSASGGVVPGEFLPGWLAALRPVLPMGVALTGVRDTAYFGGHQLARTLLVLLAWALVPLLVARGLPRRGSAQAGEAPAGPT